MECLLAFIILCKMKKESGIKNGSIVALGQSWDSISISVLPAMILCFQKLLCELR